MASESSISPCIIDNLTEQLEYCTFVYAPITKLIYRSLIIVYH